MVHTDQEGQTQFRGTWSFNELEGASVVDQKKLVCAKNIILIPAPENERRGIPKKQRELDEYDSKYGICLYRGKQL